MLLKKWLPVKSLFVILLTATVLFTCKKIDDNSGGGTNPVPEPAPDLTTKVTTAVVSGFITNETDAAVQSATVEIGGTTVTTDKYGYFEVRNAQVTQNAATVTVNKTGYFKTVKTFIATAGKSAFFRIKLLPKTIAGSFTATAGGTITLAGMAITIPAAGVVNAGTNAAYTGTVSVAAQLISATNPDLNRMMPGDLRGLNASGNIRLLTTYGMMAVELTGAGGELLQIASGKKATITMPIPAAMAAGAPATIPLWYFDEAKGLWKEEGSATKSGSNYVGDVSHFSFWNYDVPANYVQLNCTILNSTGQPVQGAAVKISVVSNPASFAYGYTDSAGYVSGAVPANAQLLLEVFSNTTCAGTVYSQQVTTTTTNVSLGNITILTANTQAVISGSVTNCSNAPVTNGYIILQTGNTYIRKQLSNTGTYSINLLLCGGATSTVSLTGEDATAGQQSIASTHTISAGNNNIPVIQACGVTTQQFINYTINGTPQSYTAPADSLTAYLQNTVSIWFTRLQQGGGTWGYINFSGAGIAAGSTQSLLDFTCPEISGNTTIGTPINVNITEYGAAYGQYIAGNFSGVVTGPPPSNTPYNVTCSFRLKKYW